MIIIEKILFLKRISIFSSLTSYELRKIAEVVTEEDFEAGETVFAEGEFGESMYLVVDGKISIFTGRPPAIKMLASFDKGNFFGEMGLYDDKPRAASATADVYTRTLVLRKGEFCDLISEFPMVALGIMKELNNRIRATNKKLNLIEKNIVDSGSRLYARDYFLDCMQSMLTRSGNEKNSVGFLLIRLVKVHFGEQGSEENDLEKFRADLLRELGGRIESFVRETDMLCRFDDNSILVMIPEFNSKSIMMFQARITDNLNRVLIDFETGRNLYADLEFRSVVFPDDAATAEEVTKKFENR